MTSKTKKAPTKGALSFFHFWCLKKTAQRSSKLAKLQASSMDGRTPIFFAICPKPASDRFKKTVEILFS